MPKTRRCSVGLHRWTKEAEGTTLRCFNCRTERPVGKRLRCRLGLHRWMGISKDGGESFRQCFYCLKYGGSPKFVPGGDGGS